MRTLTALGIALFSTLLVRPAHAQAPAPPPLADQVRAAEAAFAATLANRDFTAFGASVSDEAVFFGRGGPLRGKTAVLEAWRAYAACLEALGPKVKTDEWKLFVLEMRRAFDEWPDMRELADDMEAKHLFPTMPQDEIFLSCKRAYDRLISEKKRRGDYDRTRYDLIQKAVERESSVLMADRAKNAEKLANMLDPPQLLFQP